MIPGVSCFVGLWPACLPLPLIGEGLLACAVPEEGLEALTDGGRWVGRESLYIERRLLNALFLALRNLANFLSSVRTWQR